MFRARWNAALDIGLVVWFGLLLLPLVVGGQKPGPTAWQPRKLSRATLWLAQRAALSCNYRDELTRVDWGRNPTNPRMFVSAL